MPIFMDRHNIPGISAEHVAQAHQMDLKVQDQYGCKALTYWFDETSGIAFCLVEAPEKQAVIDMHNNAHGLIPNQIIEVERNLVKSFLSRITDPKTSSDLESIKPIINESGFRVIVSIELKNPELLILERTNYEIDRFLSYYNNLVGKSIYSFEGMEIKDEWGSKIISFVSLKKAIKCAIKIQDNLRDYTNKKFDNKTYVSVGITAGAPVTKKNDLFRDAIDLAKRLSFITSYQTILMSSSVRNIYKSENLNLDSVKKHVRVIKPAEENFINELISITDKCFNNESFSLNDLIRRIGMSRSQLYRKIISITGYSPSEFIKEFRLRKALKLMNNHHENISQIAFETGFNSHSYFSRCFQKRYGILPSDYIRATL